VVLSAHEEEKFTTETEAEKLTLHLKKARKRFVIGSEPETRYCFAVLSREPLPENDT
jgi:hypothetical protein